MPPLDGRLALVTGASSGIGAATARALHAAGARVVLAARRAERLEALARELPGSEPLELDVRDAARVRSALEGRDFDVAVANAGLALGLGPLQDGDPEDWSVMLDTNVKGLLHVVRAVVPRMLERGRGDVVVLGSVAGRQVYPGGNVYCATKHAVRALYEAMRLDMAGKGLRFTTVDPGLVETEFSLVRYKGDAERAKQVYQGLECLRPADVADAILYALTRPPHVNVGEIVLWPTDQASTTVATRR
ncbi:MAG TPA: SDR family NAD(P)-dependent oxidoreductase [Planctomycetota bacterium]|nr:SDR family NAD(P)-dependent oxidoreductase [Planctomycetota bacterium]